MTEEKADQIIRCVKECWWQVLILLVVGLGLALALFHGWPAGEWAIGWSALSSVGTVLAAFAAFRAANVALGISRAARDQEAQERQEQARIYEWLFARELVEMEGACRLILRRLESYLDLETGTHISMEQCEIMQGLTKKLTAAWIDQKSDSLHVFGVSSGIEIAKIMAFSKKIQWPLSALYGKSHEVTDKNKEGVRMLIRDLKRLHKMFFDINLVSGKPFQE